MPSFEKEFMASKGGPIQYQGKTLVMMDRFPLTEVKSLRVVFEDRRGAWRQGIGLNCDGSFKVSGQVVNGKKGLVLWQDTAPQSVDVEVSAAGEVRIKNVWDVGNGIVESWHNGAAMIVEDLPNGRRYRCNDGEADDDFDDLARIFHVM